jgi:hypothetical protein
VVESEKSRIRGRNHHWRHKRNFFVGAKMAERRSTHHICVGGQVKRSDVTESENQFGWISVA